jgi:hypothetical protein
VEALCVLRLIRGRTGGALAPAGLHITVFQELE